MQETTLPPVFKKLLKADIAGLLPYGSVDDLCRAVLEYLNSQLDFRLWMITRTEGDDWIVLYARDRQARVTDGKVFKWQDSYCYRMVAGKGPQIAPDVTRVPEYIDAPINSKMTIGAYIGVPIMRADGTLFGTLCAVDPETKSEDIEAFMPLIQLMARSIGTVLELEIQFEREQRLRERIEAESMVDELTRVYNRRGWENLIRREEQRCYRYGSPAGIMIIDLDELKEINDTRGHQAGDELLQSAANVLKEESRGSDIVARIGGDEFAMLIVESTPEQAEKMAGRLRQAFSNAGIKASIGWAAKHGNISMKLALEEADKMMYAQKHLRKDKARSS